MSPKNFIIDQIDRKGNENVRVASDLARNNQKETTQMEDNIIKTTHN